MRSICPVVGCVDVLQWYNTLHYPLLHSFKMDHLFLSHHEVPKGLLVHLLNVSQTPSLVEQIFIPILNVGSGTHRSKMMILEWEEFMKLTVERLRVSHTTKFYTIELPSAYTLHQLMSGVGQCLSTTAASSGWLILDARMVRVRSGLQYSYMWRIRW